MAMSWWLLGAGALALVLGAVVPGWDTPARPARAVKRRIYWAGTAVGVVLLFLGGLPDVQSAIAFAAAAMILMTGWAYSRTPHIKVGGKIYSAYEPNREPDPPAGV
ncbi:MULTISPECIES: hypothetical protein [Mycolicibacterium]|jgi:hypothetical protein|uniref:Transmembrane protein n=1 Tax=Mycolicibacterium vanbaalenii (strain DSM 7251 / JCM 13017 / BCRC 16820 / KCTC 9966 / NRRL B-24157 / PYR-1) TaxID=350058 RepID=A1T372_MYCVP|nr:MULTISPECIES: hypothetical protein [Mycolicibacterium]ABM11622.1 hypothetical protein Mvan_0784 [Mycolicibacterium vanbaalenii PYR-1]MCV7126301.1 hypothetical protein [Mycolicibacterium vanbaalenii PYR-1]MDW5613014.1 hypothetical protein [Mycolicibacterium sp. D5.8-2]PQP48111.1 hypothetical protein C6A88_14610 [Mycolicibacterium austroafricanum]QZT57597.1 hypothetical protein JN084_02980 [Mycolicibacterium austroafricanum]